MTEWGWPEHARAACAGRRRAARAADVTLAERTRTVHAGAAPVVTPRHHVASASVARRQPI
ncbi:hypothetical protein BLAT2472_40464 [Burkholderia latens]